MKRICTGFLLLLLVSANGFAQSIDQIVEAVRKQYAPDKRVAIFNVEADSLGNLTGFTNLPEAKQALLNQLKAADRPVVDQIQLLPSPVLGEKVFAIVNVSVANLRSNARHSAELATQALLGMPLNVLDKDRNWYQVQTPDQYISWTDSGALQLMTRVDYEQWQAAEKIIYTSPVGFVYSESSKRSQTVSDIVAGDMLALVSEQRQCYQVRYPDGRTGYVPKRDAQRLDRWQAMVRPTENALVSTAKSLMGIPYLWGGTSVKGMDCSGFTKTVYMLNGQQLPRDASQQVNVGELVETPGKNFSQLRPGDLLFFGEPATLDKPERVVHVGMWIGNNEFIHASGQIRISSMNPTAPNFDVYELNRFLRAKRVAKTSIY
ncbi:SH3 domain-containing protein [Larkinella arboricola]|uniref:SH3 domain-containing protein n=1 Tax=Larkinella arboricola TaxID=643671 RepID=A0A327WSU8_LARAB|nr:C40 family peptidase [Larkinella arboricola]RAJ95708.1 SH3 domain-containing protein [Larkinella arboricola]